MTKKKAKVYVYDPLVPINFLKKKVKNVLLKLKPNNFYDAVIISVAHDEFFMLGIKKIKALLKKNGLIFDLKSIYPKKDTDWQL